jgi:hypothetical protein
MEKPVWSKEPGHFAAPSVPRPERLSDFTLQTNQAASYKRIRRRPMDHNSAPNILQAGE